jgi:hypothetical protein
VQTFLPYPDFAASVAVLDTPRLGKQRVETLQILRALTLPEYGWRNHPAVLMWRGRIPALVRYGLASVQQWRRRGFPDSTADQIREFAPEAAGLGQSDLQARGLLPSWVGDDRLHRSHQSRLLAKDPAHYRRFFPDVPDDLEYYWPPPDAPDTDLFDSETGAADCPLWVIRPESAEALGRFLGEGLVGLGVGSGMSTDAAGLDLPDLREAVGGRGRVTRPLLALARFLGDVQVGDRVAVLVQGGATLLVGTVVGEYEFAGGGGPATHVRRVRWGCVVSRSRVRPPAALQDVRPLFRVRLVAIDADPVPS